MYIQEILENTMKRGGIFMKKVLSILCIFAVLTGCSFTANVTKDTPKKKVEHFFNDYQTLDSDVLAQLDTVVDRETTFTEEQKKTYRDFMKKHYQALVYEIKDEIIDGDNATVTVEIEVKDYSKILADADTYLTEHPNEFHNEEGTYDVVLFNEYRLKQIKDAKDKVKYTLNLTLTKVDDEWKLDKLNDMDESKIHGIYNY